MKTIGIEEKTRDNAGSETSRKATGDRLKGLCELEGVGWAGLKGGHSADGCVMSSALAMPSDAHGWPSSPTAGLHGQFHTNASFHLGRVRKLRYTFF